MTGFCTLDEQARRRGCRTGRPGADRRWSELRCFAFPWRSRGLVVERFHRVLLARDRERGQLLLGLEPVLHVATLRAAGFLPQLAGTLRDALLQLVVVHVIISPSDSLSPGPVSPYGDASLSFPHPASRMVRASSRQGVLVAQPAPPPRQRRSGVGAA